MKVRKVVLPIVIYADGADQAEILGMDKPTEIVDCHFYKINAVWEGTDAETTMIDTGSENPATVKMKLKDVLFKIETELYY